MSQLVLKTFERESSLLHDAAERLIARKTWMPSFLFWRCAQVGAFAALSDELSCEPSNRSFISTSPPATVGCRRLWANGE